MTDHAGPVRFPWPLFFLIAAAAGAAIAGALFPLPWPMGPFGEFLVAIGVLLAGGGAVLIGLAARHFARLSTTISPMGQATRLATHGPFAISRNPIYLGMASILAGLAFILGNPWFAMAVPVFGYAVSAVVIRAEERHLEQRFGKAWRDYAKRARRWI